MDNKYCVLGFWINPDKSEEWDILSNSKAPISLEEAKECLDEAKSDKWDKGFTHYERILPWGYYLDLLYKEI